MKYIIFIFFCINVLPCSVFVLFFPPVLCNSVVFEEYLYRVVASNEAGSVSSVWTRARTRESGKYSFKAYLCPFFLCYLILGWRKAHNQNFSSLSHVVFLKVLKVFDALNSSRLLEHV